MWNAIVQFLSTVIEFFYGLTGNFGIAVILFTLCVRLLILPLDIKSKKSTSKIQSLNPQIQKINEKYKNDPDKKNRKIQELYRDNNVSPFGGCLPLLITLPVLFLLFAALRKIASENHFELLKTILINADGSMEGLLAEIQTLVDNAVAAGNIKVSFQDILPTLFNNPGGELAKNMSAFPSIISQEKYDILINAIKAVDSDMAMQTIKETGCNFLWIKNIWIADSPLKTILGAKTAFSFTNALANGWFVLPVVAGVTTYLQTWLTTPKKSKSNADPNQNTMGLMNKIFPFMSLYFCAMYNSAFAIYWVLANLIQIAQTLVMQWIQNNKKKKAAAEKSVL